MDCKITLDGEDFTLTLNEDEQSATLTDDYGEVVTIAPNEGKGTLQATGDGITSTSNNSMEEAVNEAVRLLRLRRTQLPTDAELFALMVAYVKEHCD